MCLNLKQNKSGAKRLTRIRFYTRDGQVNAVCITGNTRTHLLAITWLQGEVDEGPNFFWSDPVFITRFFKTRGLARMLSVPTRTSDHTWSNPSGSVWNRLVFGRFRTVRPGGGLRNLVADHSEFIMVIHDDRGARPCCFRDASLTYVRLYEIPSTYSNWNRRQQVSLHCKG